MEGVTNAWKHSIEQNIIIQHEVISNMKDMGGLAIGFYQK